MRFILDLQGQRGLADLFVHNDHLHPSSLHQVGIEAAVPLRVEGLLLLDQLGVAAFALALHLEDLHSAERVTGHGSALLKVYLNQFHTKERHDCLPSQ